MTSINKHARLIPTGSENHRLDIEGLRAIAVVVVVLYHAGIPFMGGGYVGVDVFFVISGFLITGLLVREMENTGRLDLPRFYARRIRRLLPASVLTLVAVAALTVISLPQTRWASVAGDIRWSSGYLVNWRFADRAVDYLAADVAPSPVQHFWSLGVEEQFYLVWPFLLLAVTLLARRQGHPIRRSLGVGLLVVAIPSLAWSIHLTPISPGSAYFVSTTRMWELAIGGAVAIAAPVISKMPRALAELLTAGGLAGILVVSASYGEGTLFPGSAALVPVAATAAVIAAGTAHRDTSGGRLLSLSPLVAVGGFSYALYLWHWPLLVFADATWGELSIPVALSVVTVATALSWATYSRFEQPIRQSSAIISPPRRGLALGLVLTGLGVGAGFWLSSLVPMVEPVLAQPSVATVAPPTTQATPTTDSLPVTTAMTAPTSASTTTSTTTATTTTTLVPPEIGVQIVADTITPDPLVARDDRPDVYDDGCHQNQADPEPISCQYGASSGPLVVLVGDSHAAQWVPPFQLLADQYGFQLMTITKSACSFVDVRFVVGEQRTPYENCDEWNDRVMDLLIREQPRLVVTSSYHELTVSDANGDVLSVADSQPVLAEGLAETWTRVQTVGLTLVAIRDVPVPGFDVPECVVENRASLDQCAYDRDEVMSVNTAQVTAAALTGTRLVDLTDWICGPELCPAVVDDLLVWRDTHHLTATYARYLAPVLAYELGEYLARGDDQIK